MESERKPFTQTSKERMKNKIRCAGQVLSRCATSRANSNPLRSFSLLGCRPISLITSHAHSEFAALQAEPARIRYAPSRCWGCRIIRIMKSHAHSESAALQAEPARIRYAPSRCWGCRPIRIKRKDDSLVNKFPILSSFLFILTRLVAYPKYLSSNPLRAFPCLASSLAIS